MESQTKEMQAEKKDIQNLDDIKLLVDTFYGKIQQDPLLGPIFNSRIEDRWPVHLQKMYQFWQSILLGESTYNGRPFPPHANLPVNQVHFTTWLTHWHMTIDTFFEGPLATEAKERGVKMAILFLSKIEYFQNSGGRALI
jgi:hemoglobin